MVTGTVPKYGRYTCTLKIVIINTITNASIFQLMIVKKKIYKDFFLQNMLHLVKQVYLCILRKFMKSYKIPICMLIYDEYGTFEFCRNYRLRLTITHCSHMIL